MEPMRISTLHKTHNLYRQRLKKLRRKERTAKSGYDQRPTPPLAPRTPVAPLVPRTRRTFLTLLQGTRNTRATRYTMSTPVICTQHVHRRCTAGAACPHSHDLANSCRQHGVCAYYLNGNCTKGYACTHKHITHVDLRALIAAPPPRPAAPAAVLPTIGVRPRTVPASSLGASAPHAAHGAAAHASRGGARAAAAAPAPAHHAAAAATGGSVHPSTPNPSTPLPSTALVRAHKAPRTAATDALLPLLSAQLGGLTLSGHATAAGAGRGASIVVHEAMVPVKAKPVYADVHFFIDVSGSMSGSRLETCKKALCDFFHSLRDKDCVQLNSFSSIITRVVPYAPKKVLTSTFEAHVASLRTSGGTAFRDVVVQSVVDVQSATARIKEECEAKGKRADSAYRKQVVVILTDGEDTRSRATVEEMLAKVRRPGVEGYKTFIVAVAEARGSHDVVQLQTCSAAKPVEVIDAADAANIPAAFTKLKEKLQKVTSINIVMKS
ncbi:VWA domain-containing protein [archaeon]|nr:MAG: VWA domain-containing protein [archaeon]